MLACKRSGLEISLFAAFYWFEPQRRQKTHLRTKQFTMPYLNGLLKKSPPPIFLEFIQGISHISYNRVHTHLIVQIIIMKITSFLSVCTLTLVTAVAANHGRYEHKSMAPALSGAPANNPAHHWAVREARDHEHEHSAHTDDSDKKGSHHHESRKAREPHHVYHSREAGSHEYKHDAPAPKPTHHHWAAREHKHEPMHTGGAVAGKPGHHFIRSDARPSGRPNFGSGSGNFANNPFMGERFTPGSAITSVRDILTGQSGIKHTCDRCVAAMQVGQSLAHQASTADFSKAVVGLCKQVGYKSNSGCSDAFSVGKVGPYVSTLQDADLGSDGKGFCKQYFGAC
jgi:hypothetical protein